MEIEDDCEFCLRELSVIVRVILFEDSGCFVDASWLLRFLSTLIAVDACEFFK